ncbi:HK97-gp10 family putative phage morphogenesis protein [Peribacillus loiseleuriae]|uniref:HK97 gp10 family phage protein n=1 Tax=Peribacillus loiseleuriae TaxID=1679170 RepID=A0A0K9GSF3_9BACI|nr:HK97-gp10 family putative phage morphogenesis protein [Peribacillus loiseleuriae]KMY49568.1 hypothetical protein AC625_08435 [Peribacillus loiseleuriae]
MPMELEGMQQLMAHLQQMGKSVDGRVTEKALTKGAEFLQGHIKEKTPVRKGKVTGNLKENIIISDLKENQIHIGPDQQGKAFYGHFLEFGTSKMDAQPFMGPVFENKKDGAQEIMKDVIKGELRL